MQVIDFYMDNARHLVRRVSVVLLNAPNAAGKSYFIRHISKDNRIDPDQYFEMDSLKYWVEENQLSLIKVNLQLDTIFELIPRKKVQQLKNNILLSDAPSRTIKVHFLRLFQSEKPVLSVNPKILRAGESNIEFFRLSQEIFHIDIKQVAIIPTVPRYIRNLYKRKEKRLRENIREYCRIVGERDKYCWVVRNSLFGHIDKYAQEVISMMNE